MKIIKSFIIIFFVLILTGCIFEKEVTTIIEVEDNLTFLYGQKVKLYDIINIIDGSITDNNYYINTDELKEYEITVNYKNSNRKKQQYKLKYEVIDNLKPVLSVPKDMYFIKDSEINIMKKIFLGDNADRQVSYEIIGDYDNKTVGNYELEIKAIDDSNNEITKQTTLHVIENNPSKITPTDGIPLEYYIKNYKKDNNMIGIDISHYQKEIDFNKIKNAGVEFVMIKMGQGPNNDGVMSIDEYFEQNYTKAKEANLKIGVYIYSNATTQDEVDIQIKWVKELLKDKQIDLPIAYDWESWNSFYACNLNFADLNNIANKFLQSLNYSGYDVMNYGSKYYLSDIWDTNYYYTWLAQYSETTTYEKGYKMWQLSNTGLVDGIDTLVDIDIMYN